MATGTQSRAVQREDVARILREKCRKVRHDKQFSEWKLLVGASDWKDHAAGKAGATRYRVENLPEGYLGAGVYELGLVRSGAASASRRIRVEDVTVVYVGQAESVRQRLQQYGKDGSHLGAAVLRAAAARASGAPTGAPKASPLRGGGGGGSEKGWGPGAAASGKEGGIFELAFSSGYAVVFRWSKVASKEHAKAAEAALLAAFDYPWNVCMNGQRRLSAMPSRAAPNASAAMTKRVAAPCLFLLDPSSAVAAVGGAVSPPVGPIVAYLHHPSSAPGATPGVHQGHSKGTPGAHCKGPGGVMPREGHSGVTSPLPEWLVSTFGVREQRGQAGSKSRPTSPYSGGWESQGKQGGGEGGRGEREQAHPVSKSRPTSPYSKDWESQGRQEGREGGVGGRREAGGGEKSPTHSPWEAAARAAEGAAAEEAADLRKSEAKREPWLGNSKADNGIHNSSHNNTYGGWCDEGPGESEAPYGGWLEGGIPSVGHPPNSSRWESPSVRRVGDRGTSAVAAQPKRQGMGNLRQQRYGTFAAETRGPQAGGAVLCMAPLGDGLRCQAVSVKGRKRCPDHKGMRVGVL